MTRKALLILSFLLCVDRATTIANTVTSQNNPTSTPNDPLRALQLVRQPEDSVVEWGENFTMFCTVGEVAHGHFFYSWYKFEDLSGNIQFDDNTRIPNEKGAELVLPEVDGSHGGYYVCNVTVVTEQRSYTLLSNSGRLTVNYFSPPDTPMRQAKSAQENQNYVQLQCEMPISNPRLEITWYKRNEKISDDARMFVIPEDSNYNRDLIRGSLIIMFVELSDEGMYTCKTERNGVTYTLCTYTLSVKGAVQSSEVIYARFLSTVSGSTALGGSAEFYCAGIGKPPPTISWTQDGSRIETSEKYQLEDHKRRLIITNVDQNDDHAYTCSLSVTSSRPGRKNIVYLTITAPVSDINFVMKPASQLMYTNTYRPFKLNCAIDLTAYIDVDSSLNPVLYWLRNGRQVANSKRISLKTKIHESTNILESTIDFSSPNEADIGIYQCIVKRRTQLRQNAAQVTMTQLGSAYNVGQSIGTQYEVIKTPMSVDKAEEKCRSWKRNGHLVSFMNKEEIERVNRLLEENSVFNETLWIGLTSEREVGVWKWTQPADNPKHFSYWQPDSPDHNRENYAVMDQTRGGRWRDVKNKEKRKFVCKRYDNWCPSIRIYFQGKVEPLNRVETKTTQYGVGESITVTCSDRRVTMKQTLTCSRRGKYEPDDGFACPVYNSALQSKPLSNTIIFLMIMILYQICCHLPLS